jgi:hypothetical protein
MSSDSTDYLPDGFESCAIVHVLEAHPWTGELLSALMNDRGEVAVAKPAGMLGGVPKFRRVLVLARLIRSIG